MEENGTMGYARECLYLFIVLIILRSINYDQSSLMFNE
jgi:hypothetical protein